MGALGGNLAAGGGLSASASATSSSGSAGGGISGLVINGINTGAGSGTQVTGLSTETILLILAGLGLVAFLLLKRR